ncbi:MAG: hypothetical protein DCC68_03360 [Planctomycetota bacterium]|nr:MAG: hypothetical protein DCC68_03360 [Planctomycetota bacterium]
MSQHEPPTAPPTTPEEEARYHDYRGSAIPWYVRLLWLGFWILAIYYVVGYLIPQMQVELIKPP